MLRFHTVTWYSQLLAIVLGIMILYIGFILGQHSQKEVVSLDTPPVHSTSTPSTPLPPASLISFTGLSTTSRPLPPLPTAEAWQQKIAGSGIFENRLREDAAQYGDIAKRLHMVNENYSYLTFSEHDLTADGIPEIIVAYSGGGSYGVDTYEIIQDDRVIATIDAPSVGRGALLTPSTDGNGFSMTWFRSDMFPGGFCCPAAQMVTTFVFKDGTFVINSETIELIDRKE
jgi:hypothetical protein